MHFNLASLLKEPTGATRTDAIDDDVRIDETVRRVTGEVRFDRTPRGVLVRAVAHGTMDGLCSRCVKPIAYPIDIEIAEEYIPSVDVAGGSPVELQDGEEDAYRIDQKHMIDLAEPVAQYWALALPMAPLCEPECGGLCPDCGAEVAPEGHACAGEPVDSRWSALAKLKL